MQKTNEKIGFTKKQLEAITHVNGNALVSASAGSGKTRVVIERILNLIENYGASLSEILAVTFTKAAAEEMKDKLKNGLTKRYVETGNERFKEQLSLIQTADVSTIHSFCSNLLRRYFYFTELDGKFEVADEVRSEAIMKSSMDATFEELYEQRNADFLELVTVFGSHRRDGNLKNIIFKLYEFCNQCGGVEIILEKTVNNHDNPHDTLYALCMESAVLGLRQARSELLRVLPFFEDDLNRKNYVLALVELIENSIASEFDFNAFCLAYSLLKAPGTKIMNADACETLKVIRKRVKGVIDKVNGELFDESANGSLSVSKSLCQKLLWLTDTYGEHYERAKREENVVDFGDLEMLTVKLLDNQEVLNEVQSTYKYIFIDEYQDVNDVQEVIATKIGCNNVFMVGDSKQSIYAFRGCNPEHFVNKNAEYYSDKSKGVPVSLDYNFRSTKKVIEAVNNVYSELMTEDFGGTNYVGNPMLYGNRYGEYEGSAELHVVRKSKREKVEENRERAVYSVKNSNERFVEIKRSPEAELIIKLVTEALGKEFYDADAGEYKTVGFGDVCILFRSMTTKLAEDVVSGLTASSIPVSSSVKTNIIDYPEIKLLTNLLSVLVCAERDVPLASVMKVLFKFTNDELAQIRYMAKDNKLSFYACVQLAKSGEGALAKKVNDFIEWLNKKRLIAEFLGVGEVISGIIKETGYYAEVMASPYGDVKIKRIERFLAESVSGGKKYRAQEFETHVSETLSELSISEAVGDDTVKVMTMHASKGLEFPVVIVAGASNAFNFSDASSKVVLSRDKGIAVSSYDLDSMTVKENKARAVIKKYIEREAVVEELRVFYVALTRAKCKLYVTATSNSYDGIVTLDKFSIRNNLSFIPAGAMDTYFHNDYDIVSEDVTENETAVAGSEVDRELVSVIKSGLTYVYPHLNSVNLPVKRSVSEVRRFEDETFYETTSLYGESSAEKGTAYHRFFELIDFYNYRGKEDKLEFLNANKLTKEQFDEIDENKVKSILSLDIFRKIKNYELYKERKFCALIPANELGLSTSTEEVLVQGIIDLLAVSGNKAILVDYKLSTISSDSDLRKKYLTQMQLYKKAIENVLKLEVEQIVIINLLKESEIYV